MQAAAGAPKKRIQDFWSFGSVAFHVKDSCRFFLFVSFVQGVNFNKEKNILNKLFVCFI